MMDETMTRIRHQPSLPPPFAKIYKNATYSDAEMMIGSSGPPSLHDRLVIIVKVVVGADITKLANRLVHNMANE
jgi:hypothetical protein